MTQSSPLQEHHHARRWIVILSAALFFFYEFVQMHMFNAISLSLMQDFHLNATQLGNLSAMYLYADVLFLLPAGIILDRISTRWVILTALIICLMGTAGFALSTTFWQAAACHFLAGIGNACCFLSCIRLASRWFPSKMLAFVLGLVITFAMLGGLVAETPLTLLLHHFSWREAVLINAGFGVMVFFIVFLNVKDYPDGYQAQHEKQQQQLERLGFLESIQLSLSNSQNWLAGIYASLLNLPLMLLCALWGNVYLEQVHHLNDLQASTVVSMIFIGTIIGAPTIGAWSDRINLRKLPMIACALCALPTLLLFIELDYLGYQALLILFFLIGFFTSAQVLAFPVVAESNNRILTSTATALTSVLIMGGSAFFQPMFGIIIDSFWTGAQTNGSHLYSAHAFHQAMLIFPTAIIVALVCAFFIRETRCREYNSEHQTQ
jgi:MFS family permease